jgi:hypothetical protein
MEKKVCNKCYVEQEIDCFPKEKINNKIYVRNECKKCKSLRYKQWVTNNYDSVLKNKKLYNANNKEKIKIYLKSNKIRIKKLKNIRHKERMKFDIIYRLRHIFSTKLRKKFNNLYYKKSTKTEQILGCTFEEFKIYLESKFESWMTWENRGLYNGKPNYGWDIDHIIPISSAVTEEDVIRLSHYSNFQPLCSKFNRNIKRNKNSSK